MISINVQTDLDDEWRPVIINQINMSLMPLRNRMKNIRIDFRQSVALPEGATRFCCEIVVREQSGVVCEAETRHRDGLIAIRDALARVRRGVSLHEVTRTATQYKRSYV